MKQLTIGKLYVFDTLDNSLDLLLIFEIAGHDNGSNILSLIKDGYYNPYSSISEASDYYICRIIYSNSMFGFILNDIFFIDDDDEYDFYDCQELVERINELQIKQFVDSI